MHIFKNLLRGLSSQTLKFALFFTAVSAATVAILGTPAPIKQTLQESGIYTKVVGSVIQNAKQEQAKNPTGEGGDIDLSDPAIQKAVQDALPPAYIEQTANGALDGLFDWLNGKTDKPQIIIDLTDPKQKLATGIGEAAYAKAAAKPACTLAQLRTLDRNNINIFDIPCLPPGVDLQAEKAKLVNAILASDEFLKDTTINVTEQKNEKGEPVINFAELDKVPTAFKIFSSSPVIWGVVAALAAGLLVLLHDERRRGIWLIGRALVTTGVMIVAFGLVATYLSGFVKPAVDNENALVMLIPGIVKDIVGQFTKVLFTFGGTYIAVGAAIMLTLHLNKPEPATSIAAPQVDTPTQPLNKI